MVLVIDNKTSFLPAIKDWLGLVPFEVKERSDDWGATKRYDQIILSGGHDHTVVDHEKFYKKELDFIRKFHCSNTRLIGICLGFELIACAFGSQLKYLPEKEAGDIDIRITKSDPIFKSIRRMRVFESHRWGVEKLGDDLEVLAKSQDGIEALRHKELPIYGFQFHPEIPRDTKVSDILLKNLLKN